MRRLLHIIATPRGDESRTLRVTRSFLDRFRERYPDCVIDELNLFKTKLPELTVKRVDGKYTLLGGKDLSEDQVRAWKEIVAHIDRFRASDTYAISAPMWNFGIPYLLKQYLDIIVQPKYLFRYTDKGPEGLLKDKKMLIVTSRGGDYSEGSPSRAYDLQEPYLRTVLGFVGLTDITFINAQPMDALGAQVMEEKLASARAVAVELAERY